MKFKLEITCDNAAFEGPFCGEELARILRDIAGRVEGWDQAEIKRGGFDRKLYDVNGNAVGFTKVTR